MTQIYIKKIKLLNKTKEILFKNGILFTMENKHIRCESYILYFLNYFEIPISEYSLGKIDNKKISVLEKDNGYLIYDLNS